uniref:Fibronectin type-II domain-containing protein n=1 Tax=Laticauda laticaudata TaxID=8630 RepID=A0A8C5RS53_LATLA
MSHVYYTCAGKSDHKGPFWCSTTGNYDKDKKWSYCADTRLDANYPTSPCIFPFIFENNLYSTCTIDGRSDGRLWCSISSNFDFEPMWAYCEPSDPPPCSFPFVYRNKSYYSCTTEGALYSQLWCATIPNYDNDSKWKSCSFQGKRVRSNFLEHLWVISNPLLVLEELLKSQFNHSKVISCNNQLQSSAPLMTPNVQRHFNVPFFPRKSDFCKV